MSSAASNDQLAAVLFDLDDTLIDSIELIVRAFQHVTARHLGAPIAREVVLPTIGRPLPPLLEELAPGRGADLLATYEVYIRQHHDALVTLFPGAIETLTELRRRGHLIGIVTSKRRVVAQLAFDAFGLEERVDVTICLEDIARGKPAPDPLLEAARRLALSPARCLCVGDSVHDLLAARAAGMPSAAALWGPTARAELAAHAPTYLIREMAALLPLCPPRQPFSPPPSGR